MAQRVAELEQSLGEAQERERTQGDLEKTQVDRLLALADVIGSKYSAYGLLCLLSTSDVLRVWFSFDQRLAEVLLQKGLPARMSAW